MTNQKTLFELSREFFSRKYKYTIPKDTIKGRSGHKWKFDGLIHYQDQKYGVFIREWNRSIGVNQVRQLQKACRDTKCAGGVIIGDIFSSNAEIYGDNLGIQVVDRLTLENKLRTGL